MGVKVSAANGNSRMMPSLYWSWIRQIATEEGVSLPQSGSSTDSLSDDQTKKLAAAIRSRADKVRRGTVPRDATDYVRQVERSLFGSVGEGVNNGSLHADFDDPRNMDETAAFFDSSGGVTLTY